MNNQEYQPITVFDGKYTARNYGGSFAADLHTHTKSSDGIASAEKLVDAALNIGLNALAITDHNSLKGADRAANYVSKNNLPIELIRGVEISSQDGHVLALNIDYPIDRSLPLTKTIREIHRQKGLAIVPHPHPKRFNCVPFNKIQEILDSEDPKLFLDAIEVYNATEERLIRLDPTNRITKSVSLELMRFINKNKNSKKLGAFIASSDAHTKNVGYGVSKYSEESVLTAIANRDIHPYKSTASFYEDLSEVGLMAYAIFESHLFGSMSIFKQ